MKRYAQVGLGGRSSLFTDAACGYDDAAILVGLCDLNIGRAQLAARDVKNKTGLDVPVYLDTDFSRMIRETKTDCVIVTTKDDKHDEYLCRAMELGCDAITEKPMTTDEFKCRRILETQKRTGKKIIVTFNYRYSPPRTQVKDLLMKGVIGEVLSVDFHWMLDVYHGADYYRRWHRKKENSGGLMVHKATHHFDLVNWWLSSVPQRVYASGQRSFYTPQMAHRIGPTQRTERCHTCPHRAKECQFGLNLAGTSGLKAMYLDQENYDGYFRDLCVFSEDMDIEDSMNVVVDYASGAIMTYSLNSFMPWEGYTVTFNGSQGRLEHKCEENVYINGDGTVPGALKGEGTYIRIYPHRKPAYGLDLWQSAGGHGGGDGPLVHDVFAARKEQDPFKRAADQRSGAWSIMTGIAANHSMAQGRPFFINELCPGIELPDYPAMPTGQELLSV